MLKYAPILLAVTAPALAQNQVPPPQPQTTAPAPKQGPLDKVVCKTEDTLGSRLSAHRVCATLREWKDQQQENRDALEKMQGIPNTPSR